MSVVSWSSACLALTALSASAGSFVQRFEAVYATPEAARRAVVSAADLPAGKAFAFSQRWDDANPRHRKMADTIDPLGIKATFYVNGGYRAEFADLLRELVRRGHSIGDHTISHDFEQRLLPFVLFRDILDCRIRLEVDSQSPVNAFSIPYGTMDMQTDPDAVRRYGAALANAGLLGGAQQHRNIAAAFGLDPKRWIGTNYFSINDNDPDPRKFKSGMDICTNNALRAGNVYGPHVTMGTHTWQTDEGFRKLSGILAPLKGRDDIWFVNENTWIASRIQRFAATFRTVSVDGAKVVYEVTRPAPADLGASVPLFLSFSESPVRVSSSAFPKADILKGGLPAGADHPLPTRWAMLGDGSLQADEELETFTLSYANESDRPWSGGEATLRLPPGFDPAVVVQKVGAVAAKQKGCLVFRSRYAGARLLGEGDFFAAVQMDVRTGDGVERLWAKCLKARPQPMHDVPRDRCRVLGPFPADMLPSPSAITAQSKPGAKLADIGGTNGVWRTAPRASAYHPNAVNVTPKDKALCGRTDGARKILFAYDVRPDVKRHGRQWKVLWDVQGLLPSQTQLYANGSAVPIGEPLTLSEGAGRLVFVCDFRHPYNVVHEFALVSESDGAVAPVSEAASAGAGKEP